MCFDNAVDYLIIGVTLALHSETSQNVFPPEFKSLTQCDYSYAALKNNKIFSGIKLNYLGLTQIHKNESHVKNQQQIVTYQVMC